MASDLEEFLKVLAGGVRGYTRGTLMRKEEEAQAARDEENKRRWEAEQERLRLRDEQLKVQYEGAQLRGMQESGYERAEMPALTGDPGSMAAFGAAAQGKTAYPDIGGWWNAPPTEEESAARDFQTLLDQMGQQRTWEREQGGAPGQVFSQGDWQWPPGYGKQAGGVGPSGADEGRFRKWAADEADRAANAQGWTEIMTGNVKPEFQGQWDSVFNTALQNFMGGGPPSDETDFRLGNEMVQFIKDVAAGNPEALAELAALKDPNNPDADPAYAWLIELGAQNIPAEEAPTQTTSLGFPAELAIMLAGMNVQAPEVGWPKLEDLWRRGQVNPASGGGAR